MSDQATAHAPQFDNASQQRESATFGMWIFLATEVLFFGAIFLGYTAYRLAYPAAFAAASFASHSQYSRPVIFGHQKCRPPR